MPPSRNYAYGKLMCTIRKKPSYVDFLAVAVESSEIIAALSPISVQSLRDAETSRQMQKLARLGAHGRKLVSQVFEAASAYARTAVNGEIMPFFPDMIEDVSVVACRPDGVYLEFESSLKGLQQTHVVRIPYSVLVSDAPTISPARI